MRTRVGVMQRAVHPCRSSVADASPAIQVVMVVHCGALNTDVRAGATGPNNTDNGDRRQYAQMAERQAQSVASISSGVEVQPEEM